MILAIPLLLISGVAAFTSKYPRAHELRIYRVLHFTVAECSSITLREAQPQKRLLSESVAVSDRRLYDARGQRVRDDAVAAFEQLTVFSFDVQYLRTYANTLCGADPLEHTQASATWVSQLVLDVGSPTQKQTHLPLQIEPLIQSGPSSNRVDLVFFSDGYTQAEYGKFKKDVMRLALGVSSNHTFNTVKPLLNFWSAFTPSNESGIGVGGTPKDTPYGLYRDGTELRGVYYSKPEVARAACASMGDGCDFPILIGNDPYYGGLGGEFTVITPSLANGPLVLRHELGHSIIDVGEEYDGGFAYFGTNAATDRAALPWAHWLTDTTRSSTPPRAERSSMPFQAYPWTMLNTSTPWTANFTSAGTYARALLKFSLSGVVDAADLTVTLDGKDVGWTPRDGIGADRWHYDIPLENGGLSEGSHTVGFELRNAQLVNAQVCSVEMLEFGDEHEFNATMGYYGAFPTFSMDNETTFRPTNNHCLMRAVTTPNFCSACLEGLWLALLARVDLIDDFTASCDADGKRSLALQLVPFAHAGYTIEWRKDGRLLEGFANKTRVETDGGALGVYEVAVAFSTEEVRVDPEGFLTAGANIEITGVCATEVR